MIAGFLLGLAVQAWTWTLYPDGDTLVLANEVPDTDRLRATLECLRGSGMMAVVVYDTPLAAGFGRVEAGGSSAAVTFAADRPGRAQAMVPTDHPVVRAFARTGRLSAQAGPGSASLTVDRPQTPVLRRFIAQCG